MLAIAGDRHRFDRKAGFLLHFARHRLDESLAALDHAAGKREQVLGRRPRPLDDQHMAIPNDRGADSEVGSIGEAARVSHRCDVSSTHRR
jgi:hypothetical protein